MDEITKEKIKKRKLNKKKLAIFLSILIVIILIIFIVVMLFFRKNIDTYENKNQNLYIYREGIKMFYNGELRIKNGNEIENLIIEKQEVYAEHEPFYYEKEDKMLLPKATVIVFPYYNARQFQLPIYTVVDNTNINRHIVYKDVNAQIDNCFIFDGKDTYYFIDPVEVQVDNDKYNLSGLSYINTDTDGNLILMDYKSESMTKIEKFNRVIATIGIYEIDLLNDKVVGPDYNRLLLSNIKYSPYFKNDSLEGL